MSLAFRKRTCPPSSRMPTSKETRVRVEDFEKIRAQNWPANGRCWLSPRWRLRTAVFSRMCRMSARDIFSMLNRFFISIWVKTKGLTGQLSHHGADDADPFRGFRLLQVQRRQEANDIGAGRNGQQPRLVEVVYELD